jgi:hypothetical protein
MTTPRSFLEEAALDVLVFLDGDFEAMAVK